MSTIQEFDQVVEGNIDIKQLSKNKYQITFSQIRKFLLYQVWSDSSQQLNDNRLIRPLSKYIGSKHRQVKDINSH